MARAAGATAAFVGSAVVIEGRVDMEGDDAGLGEGHGTLTSDEQAAVGMPPTLVAKTRGRFRLAQLVSNCATGKTVRVPSGRGFRATSQRGSRFQA